MSERLNISSGSPWEDNVGYARAVRVGDSVFVSGTTASDASGETIAPGDGYEQMRFILNKISRSLGEAGASMRDVVRTRMYVTDPAVADEVGRAHRELFGVASPVATMVVVAALLDPEWLVEIEVQAVVDR